METESSVLTTSDRLLWAAFAIFILFWAFAGISAAIYIQFTYGSGETATGSDLWKQMALYLLGMFGGTALGLLLTRLVCRRFVSLQTQKRWFDALKEVLEDPYVMRRGPAVIKFFIWAVVPDRDAL